MKLLSIFERLVLAHISSLRHDACWLWHGSRDRKGYGFISVNGKTRRVHIVAWELATGRKLRKGQTLNHRCRNTSCWRPSHVHVMSRSRNTADGNRANPRSTEKARAAKRAKLHPIYGDMPGVELVNRGDGWDLEEIVTPARDTVFDDGHGGVG